MNNIKRLYVTRFKVRFVVFMAVKVHMFTLKVLTNILGKTTAPPFHSV